MENIGINGFWHIIAQKNNVVTGYNLQATINNIAKNKWEFEVATGGSDFNYNCCEEYRAEIIKLAESKGLPEADIKKYLEEPTLLTPPYVDNYWA